ncbi:hypothetical protein NCC78_04860 [Micromonospora phytophila]|uniref:hypothetical protein n=1 Tax=Micromonospora phytophila TaxID=709888 RepID=UPI00203092EE|nr:hypothetical protein [Micromonospora phytophila]MCM0674034.1 hypothetical protein [Micromonospora phytophila]
MPDDGWLVHAAFGLRPWRGKPLPLVEGDLPPGFLALNDDEQDRKTSRVLSIVMSWAVDLGMDRLRVMVSDSYDRNVLEQADMRSLGRGDYEGQPTPATISAALRVINPDRLWACRRADVLVYVHETWDSVVVSADAVAVADLDLQLRT